MNTTFNLMYDSARKIAYNSNWWCVKYKDYNRCVIGEYAPKLKRGEIFSSVDAFGRKLLIIGTNGTDNIVLYERYAKGTTDVIVSNETFEFSMLVKIITDVDISNVLSDSDVLAIYETISRDVIEKISKVKNDTIAVHAWSN